MRTTVTVLTDDGYHPRSIKPGGLQMQYYFNFIHYQQIKLANQLVTLNQKGLKEEMSGFSQHLNETDFVNF